MAESKGVLQPISGVPRRTGLAFVLLSAGTPMLTGGDEYLRSLNCNNNPYDVDSIANWLNYSWTTDQTNFSIFGQRMIAFRNAHPALRTQAWYSGLDDNGGGMAQLRWYTPAGALADSSYWSNPSNHSIAWRIDGTQFLPSAYRNTGKQ